MSMSLLAVLVLAPTAAVVIAIFLVLWRERTSARQSLVAVVSGVMLAAWALVATMLARRGFFLPPGPDLPPPTGITLALVLLVLAACLLASRSLRGLLTNQRNLILLNLWRLVGAVFLVLMAKGQMPALWALPAGIGDVIVGAMAPWIARGLDAPGGRRAAILFNVFGMADLVVAVGLGIMTSPGPAQLFHTTPTSELVTRFPLVLVPTVLVPLAWTLHVVSLWQLVGGSWAPRRAIARIRHGEPIVTDTARRRQTALVTGASSGIGLELARLLATDAFDLVIVSRTRERLAEIGQARITTWRVGPYRACGPGGDGRDRGPLGSPPSVRVRPGRCSTRRREHPGRIFTVGFLRWAPPPSHGPAMTA